MTTTFAGTLTTAKNGTAPNTLTLKYPYLTSTTTPVETGKSRNQIGNTTYFYDVNPDFYNQNTGFTLLKFNHMTNCDVPIKNVSIYCKPVNSSNVLQDSGTYTIEWWTFQTKQADNWALFDSNSVSSGPQPRLVDFVQYYPNQLIYPRLTSVGGGATGVELWVDGVSILAIPKPTA
jgi:hypothetical protein